MTFEDFKDQVTVSIEDMCRRVYRENRHKLKIKKEDLAVKNYVTLINATLKLSNEKGFQAMSIRDLGRDTGLSMGALYYYFSSKDELLQIIHEQGHRFVQEILLRQTAGVEGPREKLRSAIRTHLFLSEIMRHWFYFFFMETKNLSKKNRLIPVESELWTEKFYMDILAEGEKAGIFNVADMELTGAAIKSLLQDWYLKRWKYVQRKVSIEQYADFIISFVEASIST